MSAASPTSARWQALGTTVELRLERPGGVAAAQEAVRGVLEQIDVACSRFRADSDLSRAERACGRAGAVGPLLLEALERRAARRRADRRRLDPTIGARARARRLRPRLGADRGRRRPRRGTALRRCRARGAAAGGDRARPRPAARAHPARASSSTSARAPKRWPPTAPRAPACTSRRLRRAGRRRRRHRDRGARRPPGGWRIHVTDDHRDGPDAPGQRITIAPAGSPPRAPPARAGHQGGQRHAPHHRPGDRRARAARAGAPSVSPPPTAWTPTSRAPPRCVRGEAPAWLGAARAARAPRRPTEGVSDGRGLAGWRRARRARARLDA